jgi:hypothetical protein
VGLKWHEMPSSLTTSTPSLVGRSHRITRAPFCTKRVAVALPRPEAAPVTIATREASAMTAVKAGATSGEFGGGSDHRLKLRFQRGPHLG